MEKARAECSALRADAALMAEQLKEAENALRAHRGAGPATPPAPQAANLGGRSPRPASESGERAAAEDEGEGDGAEHAARLAELEAHCGQMAEENSRLLVELQSRPTAEQLSYAEQQIRCLERELSDGRRSASNCAPSRSTPGARDPRSTSERMRRDRSLSRLKLRDVGRLPHDMLVEIVQDACIALELNSATHLPGTVANLARVTGAVPQMELFVSQCCEAVFGHGQHFLPPGAPPDRSPHSVPAVLKHWLKLLHRSEDLEGMARDMSRLLALRADPDRAPVTGTEHISTAELTYAVKRLIEAERAAAAAGHTFAAAAQVLRDPQELLHHLVARFQELFDCPKLESVDTCMSQLYIAVEEGRNFKRNLAALLGLRGSATLEACMAVVRRLLDHHGRTLDLRADYKRRLEADQAANLAGMAAVRRSQAAAGASLTRREGAPNEGPAPSAAVPSSQLRNGSHPP